MDDFFDQHENALPRIGDQAPAFRSVTSQGTIYFPGDYFGKWVILFNYCSPDFTPESASESIMFASMFDDLKALNCELVGISVDGFNNHTVGYHSIKEKLVYKSIKDVEIKFPLIKDIIVEVARKYGMIETDENVTKAVRGVFLIDPNCIIRSIIYSPLSLDLNFNELKRVIIALQAIDASGDEPGITKAHLETQRVDMKYYSDWFLCTKELSEGKMINVN